MEDPRRQRQRVGVRLPARSWASSSSGPEARAAAPAAHRQIIRRRSRAATSTGPAAMTAQGLKATARPSAIPASGARERSASSTAPTAKVAASRSSGWPVAQRAQRDRRRQQHGGERRLLVGRASGLLHPAHQPEDQSRERKQAGEDAGAIDAEVAGARRVGEPGEGQARPDARAVDRRLLGEGVRVPAEQVVQRRRQLVPVVAHRVDARGDQRAGGR